MKKVLWVVILVIGALSLSACCCFVTPGGEISSKIARNLSAGPVQRETRAIELGEADQVQTTIKFGGGELDLRKGGDPLLVAEFVYNLDSLRPEIDYTVQGKQGVLDIQHKADPLRLEHLTTEIRNEWSLEFCDCVPLDLRLDVGASSGMIELGGLRVRDLDVTTGAADLRIEFDEPNLERLSSLHIYSGAAKLELHELGNANLDELAFDGGLGTYLFDFGGEWQRSASARILAGASQVTLRVPRDIGVRICPGDLHRGNYGGLEKQGDCYVNRLYDQSGITLDIDLDMGLGKLDVRQVH
jgi:hypothetical protein